MIAVNNEPGFWPTRSQELILRAALMKGNEAINAWKEWRQTTNIDVLDFGSHRMIPQLYRNLMDQDVQDPLMERFKGVYRYYLYKNETLLHKASHVLTAFRDAGIDTILLKGSALVPLYYRESGLRPMQDVDVLVRVQDAQAAMALLKRLGWSALALPSRPEKLIPIRHSIPFADREGRQIDLHWHLLWECWHGGDNDYWNSAVPISCRGVSTLTVNPTHQLLHTCWHGARWNEVPPIRWIADAMAILNSSATEIDWDLIVEKARRHHISLPLKDSLSYLKALLRAPVPDSVIKSLESIPVSRMDRIGYEAAANPLAPPNTRRILALLFYDYLWLTKSTSVRPRLFAYARFLQAKWDLKHVWQVPFYLSFRTVLRAFRSIIRQNGSRARTTAEARREQM
jgi:Uncharacterised nucleotidyltransferase